MQSGAMDPAGLDQAKAGKICGIISVVLLGFGLVIAMIYVVFAAIFIGASAAQG